MQHRVESLMSLSWSASFDVGFHVESAGTRPSKMVGIDSSLFESPSHPMLPGLLRTKFHALCREPPSLTNQRKIEKADEHTLPRQSQQLPVLLVPCGQSLLSITPQSNLSPIFPPGCLTPGSFPFQNTDPPSNAMCCRQSVRYESGTASGGG